MTQERSSSHRDIFTPRLHYKPFEYPEVAGYREAIQHAFWLHTTWSFQSDVQHYRVRVSPVDRECIKRAILAISDVEVRVKSFWGRLGEFIPKDEIAEVGAVFADSEVRHAHAYSHLLEVLGLSEEFYRSQEVPALRHRRAVLDGCLGDLSWTDPARLGLAIAKFGLVTENSDLFTQFLILRSYNRELGVFKEIDNVVQATQQEERVHALFAAWLIGQMRQDRPEQFGPAFEESLRETCRAARDAGIETINWMMEEGDPDFLSKADAVAFLEGRLNQGLVDLGMRPEFEPDPKILANTAWFGSEMNSRTNFDNFHKRSTAYAARVVPITADTLFA